MAAAAIAVAAGGTATGLILTSGDAPAGPLLCLKPGWAQCGDGTPANVNANGITFRGPDGEHAITFDVGDPIPPTAYQYNQYHDGKLGGFVRWSFANITAWTSFIDGELGGSVYASGPFPDHGGLRVVECLVATIGSQPTWLHYTAADGWVQGACPPAAS